MTPHGFGWLLVAVAVIAVAWWLRREVRLYLRQRRITSNPRPGYLPPPPPKWSMQEYVAKRRRP